ncbi:MAG: metallophosphoesterase family protein [Deltaproteobacteria bacterium]|nr:metallophosphoesterase family protein [Deltaproteobacteria bacterium]
MALKGVHLGFALTVSMTACAGPLGTPDASSDVVADAPNDAIVASDVEATPESGPPPVRMLRYVPQGCAHTVRTPPRAMGLVQGDRGTLGPSPMPRAVHVNFAAAPQTTAAFLWNTDPQTLASVVEYGTAPDRLDQNAVGHVMTVGPVERVTTHEVHVCDLRPNTTYYYRVGGSSAFSQVQSFRTAPDSALAPVSFAFCGDSRGDVMVWQQVNEAIARQSGMRQPDALLFTGDAVDIGLIQTEWDGWFRGARNTLATMPFVMAHGNHEGLAVNYLSQFAQPQTDSDLQSEMFFSMDYGPVHLVVLNDTGSGNLQEILENTERVWLEADLQRAESRRAQVPWIVVMHHKGAFSSASHTDDADTAIIRRVWAPIFARFHVDAVLNGHDHHFELTHPLDGAGAPVVAPAYGVTYVTAAASGAPLYGRNVTQPWTRTLQRTVNFGLLRASKTSLQLDGFRVDEAGLPSAIVDSCVHIERDTDGSAPTHRPCI